ncbi:hypothetical protein C2845_PM04G24440 [Panicum miliaceum]|uniref:Vacuolar protein sorting-associated protein 24 homolog 1-like n=1 Tax=Panicum miliaceum TaxID=4540 RepID=A0A3L6QLF1_PANMI|nr:hypothetical protein C2845_PM04G24440 [Panicum miliaceum]
MEKVKNLLKPRPTPQQQLREWQRRLRNECRVLDRQIRDVQREEKNVEKAIREAAKRNDMGSAKALAKELVRSRRAVNRLYENKAQLNSVSMHLGEIVATARTVGHLSKSAEVMKIVNNLMKAPELAATMQEFSKEMTKAGVMEEMVNDAVDSALDSEDMEEEIEEEVDKVLASVAGETASQLPDAARTQKIQQASTSKAPEERQAVAEGVDDNEEDLEEIRARLAKGPSDIGLRREVGSHSFQKFPQHPRSIPCLTAASSSPPPTLPTLSVSADPAKGANFFQLETVCRPVSVACTSKFTSHSGYTNRAMGTFQSSKHARTSDQLELLAETGDLALPVLGLPGRRGGDERG